MAVDKDKTVETESLVEVKQLIGEIVADKQAKWSALRKPFDKSYISKMPRGGVSLDYVGHAHVTDRLNTAVGPENWNWGPMALTEAGTPYIDIRKDQAILWGWFEILGVRKNAVGTATVNKGELEKELIGDLIRNGAMRFGVALDLWAKGDLESQHEDKPKLAPPPGPVPISNLSKTTLRQAFTNAGLSGELVTEVLMEVIGKPQPETEEDAAQILAHLAKSMTK